MKTIRKSRKRTPPLSKALPQWGPFKPLIRTRLTNNMCRVLYRSLDTHQDKSELTWRWRVTVDGESNCYFLYGKGGLVTSAKGYCSPRKVGWINWSRYTFLIIIAISSSDERNADSRYYEGTLDTVQIAKVFVMHCSVEVNDLSKMFYIKIKHKNKQSVSSSKRTVIKVWSIPVKLRTRENFIILNVQKQTKVLEIAW